MRARLLDAAVEVLVERGWAATTTTLVSARAGVSRGAQLHHFPTKNDLVVAAVDHVMAGRADALRDAVADHQGAHTRAVLEMLADHFTSPGFKAALELWVAARTDPDLLAAVAPLERRIGREAHQLTVDLLSADETKPGVRELIQATLDLCRGLCLADTLSDDTKRRSRILDEWAKVLEKELA
jgi:AcrR family transcriptional regulator